MNNVFTAIIAVIGFLLGGLVISWKDKHTVTAYREEAKKQAAKAVEAKASADKATKEREASAAASEVSSSVATAVAERTVNVAKLKESIEDGESRLLTDEELKRVQEIMLDSD